MVDAIDFWLVSEVRVGPLGPQLLPWHIGPRCLPLCEMIYAIGGQTLRMRQTAQHNEVKQMHQELARGDAVREHAVLTAAPWHGIALLSARQAHT